MHAVKTLSQPAHHFLFSPLISALSPNRDAKHPPTLHPDTHGESYIQNMEVLMEDALTDILSLAGSVLSRCSGRQTRMKVDSCVVLFQPVSDS